MASEYKACFVKGLSAIPKTATKEERKLGWCMVAKICSSKAATPEEAMKLCQQPKAPKAPRQHRTKKMFYDPDAGAPQIPDGYEVMQPGME